MSSNLMYTASEGIKMLINIKLLTSKMLISDNIKLLVNLIYDMILLFQLRFITGFQDRQIIGAQCLLELEII